mgnify:CR=1 FL=1
MGPLKFVMLDFPTKIRSSIGFPLVFSFIELKVLKTSIKFLLNKTSKICYYYIFFQSDEIERERVAIKFLISKILVDNSKVFKNSFQSIVPSFLEHRELDRMNQKTVSFPLPISFNDEKEGRGSIEILKDLKKQIETWFVYLILIFETAKFSKTLSIKLKLQ